MSYELHALFLEIDNKFVFYKYFWEGMDAFYFGESSSVLLKIDITNYKLEEHKILSNFDFQNSNSYFELAKEYEVI